MNELNILPGNKCDLGWGVAGHTEKKSFPQLYLKSDIHFFLGLDMSILQIRTKHIQII